MGWEGEKVHARKTAFIKLNFFRKERGEDDQGANLSTLPARTEHLEKKRKNRLKLIRGVTQKSQEVLSNNTASGRSSSWPGPAEKERDLKRKKKNNS